MDARETGSWSVGVAACGAAALLAAAGGCAVDEPLDLPAGLMEQFHGIVGGSATAEWPAVGAYFINGGNGGMCTATLVRPDVAITASHCAEGSGLQDSLYFGFDIYDATMADLISIDDAITHPNYINTQSALANDIAVLLLWEPLEDRPFIPVNTVEVDGGWIGDRLHYVGYGSNTWYGGPGSGQKRETDIEVVQYSSTTITHYTTGTNTCSGDSGGPAFVDHDGSGDWYLAGVISYGYPVESGQDTCAGAGVEMRVDAYLEFLSEYFDPYDDPYYVEPEPGPPVSEGYPEPNVDADAYGIDGGFHCAVARGSRGGGGGALAALLLAAHVAAGAARRRR